MATVEETREKAYALIEEGKVALRSCHECNAAHEYFKDDEDVVISCIACGTWWLGAIDLMEYEEEES